MPLGQALPVLVNEWVVLAGGITALAITIGGFIFRLGRLRQEMLDSFRSQGERIGEVEVSCASSKASIEELRRIDQQHEFQILGFAEKMGEFGGKLDRLKETLNKQAEQKAKVELEIVDRLARIEERMDVFIKLHRES